MLPVRDPLRGLGPRRTAVPWLRRVWSAAAVEPDQVTDLTRIDGDPTARASVDVLRVSAEDDDAGYRV